MDGRPSLESIAMWLASQNTGYLEDILERRLRRLPTWGLPPLARDEDPADIFIDSCEWLREKGSTVIQLQEACKIVANRWSSQTEFRWQPEPLGELLYLCGRIGVQGAIDAIAKVLNRNDLVGLTLPGGEDLQLRALRSLCGLLVHSKLDERESYRSLLERALDNPQHLRMALSALVAFWPGAREGFLSRVKGSVDDADLTKKQLDRNVGLMQQP